MVADDANYQAATPDAFALLNFIASTRLRAGRLTVIDATSVSLRPANRWSSWPGNTTASRWPSC